MNIIEAHKSGRRFKRPMWGEFVILANVNGQARVVTADGCGDDYLEVADFEATDFILEPEAKLLTKEQVKAAIIEGMSWEGLAPRPGVADWVADKLFD